LSIWRVFARAEAAGVVFVAAAGNDFQNDNDQFPVYPGAFASPADPDGQLSNVISVAALDINENLAIYSNVGRKSVLIAGPGGGLYFDQNGNFIIDERDILSTIPLVNQLPPSVLKIGGGKYGYLAGSLNAVAGKN
jgi:subtilisin family serine protease